MNTVNALQYIETIATGAIVFFAWRLSGILAVMKTQIQFIMERDLLNIREDVAEAKESRKRIHEKIDSIDMRLIRLESIE